MIWSAVSAAESARESSGRAMEMPSSRPTHHTAHSIRTIENQSKLTGPTLVARNAVIADPAIAPRPPPALTSPKSRRLWPSRKMSVMKDQKIETTKRLNTASHMKNTRPTHTVASSGNVFISTKNRAKFAMARRYAVDTKRLRGQRDTAVVKRGWTNSVPARVPVKSHGMFSTPLATAISSRIGRMT